MDELEACELISFRAAIKAGIPAIMSSHILFPNIEPNGVPATMSRTIMHGLLRETLGFDGLILSDCMVMDAIPGVITGTAHGVVEAMRAGVDMVFVSSNADLQRESAAAALAAAENGSIDARELDGSAERILRAKERWIHPAEPESAGRAEDFAAAARMAREAVTAVRGKACRASEKTFFCGCADYRMTQASNADPEAKAFPEYMGARFGAKFAVCSKDPGREGDRRARQMRGRSGKYHLFLLQRAPLPRPARSRGGARRKGRADDRGGASQPLRSSGSCPKMRRCSRHSIIREILSPRSRTYSPAEPAAA